MLWTMALLRRLAPLLLPVAAAACASRPRPAPGPAPLSGGAASGTVIFPDRYDAGRRYDVVVMLPASNGTAEAMRRSYPDVGNVIVILAAGEGTTDDYRTNGIWARTIARYEGQLLADLEALEARHVRIGRVVLAGFSMGGDLAWALAVRNAARVDGAVVMGSRMSYRGPPGDVHDLRAHHVRIAILMGRDDQSVRRRGAQAAERLLKSSGVATRRREVRGLGHMRAPAGDFRQALRFALGR